MFDHTPLPPNETDELCARVLVIVPALNEAPGIEAALRSLLDGAPTAQIIVMDGGSTDDTVNIVRQLAQTHPNLSIHQNPRRRQAAALNDGVHLGDADRDILIRCDAHAHYPPGFVADLAHSLVAGLGDNIAVPMDAVPAPGAGCFAKANAWSLDTLLGTGGSAHRGGHKSGYVDHGHHAAFWRDRFIELNGYDETLIANEDAEYDTRLRAQGGKIWLETGLRIAYHPRATLSALWQQYFSYGQGRAQHVLHHKVWPRLRQLIPVLHIGGLLGSLLLLLLMPALSAVYPLVYGTALAAATAQVAIRQRAWCALLVPVALFAMHTSWGLGFLKTLLRSQGPS